MRARDLNGVRVQASSGAALRMSEDKVAIRGAESAVAAAKAAISALLAKYRAENRAVSLRPEAMPLLIGKGGATIKKLREETGCRIEVGDGGGGHRGGDKASSKADKASKADKQRGAAKAGTSSPSDLPSPTLFSRRSMRSPRLTERVHARRASLLFLTAGGASSQSDFTLRPVVCHVRGDDAAAAERGVAAVVAAVGEENVASSVDACVSMRRVTVPIASSEGATAIIGKGGATVRALQDKYGVKIDVDRKAATVAVQASANACIFFWGALCFVVFCVSRDDSVRCARACTRRARSGARSRPPSRTSARGSRTRSS